MQRELYADALSDEQTSLATLAASVDRRDWETATRNLQRAMAVDKAITTSAFAESVVVRSIITRLVICSNS